MELNKIYEKLCEMAPLSLAEGFDNPGHLVGDKLQEVSKTLLCLDVTDAVINEAISEGAELIVSHHPLFFSLGKAITTDTPYGKKIIKLLENKISIISMHTNMDIAMGGVNDMLISQLGLIPAGSFSTFSDGKKYEYGRIGELKNEMELNEFAALVAERLGTQHVRYSGERKVRRIGVVGGSASALFPEAISVGCDTFITGEVKHLNFIAAPEEGINILEGGHFHTERMVVRSFEKFLAASFPTLKILISKSIKTDVVKFS